MIGCEATCEERCSMEMLVRGMIGGLGILVIGLIVIKLIMIVANPERDRDSDKRG